MRLIFVLRDKLVFICHEKCEGECKVEPVKDFEDLSKVYQAIIDTGKANFVGEFLECNFALMK
jgi:hypothetical protein